MSEIKFCKDCKHARPWLFDYSLGRCSHPSVCDLADGSGGKYCTTERNYGGCGREAKNFEQKIKWWQK